MRAITLRVLCEGPTEANFVTQLLAPHLGACRVYARPVNLGGIRSFESLREAIKHDVGRARDHEYVTTMLDLYALPKYPGDSRDRRLKGLERAAGIEAAMAERLPNPRFIPYIQVHEFEALVFVDLDQLPASFPDGEARDAPEALRRSLAGLAPEEIDDGPDTAPSKRLIRAIPAYRNLKAIEGPKIAVRIGLQRLRARCPHLDGWIRRLETLAESA